MNFSSIPYDAPMQNPPPGQHSDFNHPIDDGRRVRIIATLAVCVTLSTTSAVLRAWTRWYIVERFGWDDALAILAVLLNFGVTACFVGLLNSGLRFISWNVRLRYFMENWFAPWLFWNAVFTLLLYFTFAAIKSSILFFYLRILGPARVRLRAAVWVILACVICILIGTLAALLKFCDPPAKLFRPLMPGKCSISATLFIAQAALQIATDLMILVPPIFMVWRLNLSFARKISVSIIMGVGLFVTCVGITRLEAQIRLLHAPNLSVDIDYLGSYLAIFEVNFSVVAICLPALSQFFNAVRNLVSREAVSSSGPAPAPPNGNRRSVTCETSDGTYIELDSSHQWSQETPEMQKSRSDSKDMVTASNKGSFV